MGRREKRPHGSDIVFLTFFILLLAVLVWFGFLVVQKARSGKTLCQSVVSLGKMEYNEAFLEEAEKISGICSITPVLELPVRMKAGDYTMEMIWLGTDLSELERRAVEGAETPLGSVPALLLGEKSLAGMTDSNGQPISEKKQKELLSQFQEIEWQYCLMEAERVEGGASPGWSPCRIAGILSWPSDDIFLSYSQAADLIGVSASQSVKKILLTVRGEDNYKRALGYFAEK